MNVGMNLNKRSQQIHSTMFSYMNVGREKPIKKISSDYIVGLTDGEGCFYVNVRSPDKRYLRSTTGIETHFYIKLREDDLPLLEEVKNFFGCGAIYLQKENRKNHSTCYRFEINSQKDICEVVIPFFDKNSLRSKKVKNYLIFRKIALMVKEGKHRINDGLKEILVLKSLMNNGARLVREIRSPSGNAKLPKLLQSARQVRGVGGTRTSIE